MIQFNLLPDIKIEFMKAQRLKRILMISSVIAMAASVGLLLLAVGFSTSRKIHLDNLSKDINRLTGELNSIEDLNKILSVQNQLGVLPALYDGRPAVDRLPDFLTKTTPIGVGLGRVSVDFSTSTINITGTSQTLQLINNYVDTLKFTTFRTDEEGSQPQPAFSSVGVTQIGRGTEGAAIELALTFNPEIFNITKNITLDVPSIVTTYEQVPGSELFDGSGVTETTEGAAQ